MTHDFYPIMIKYNLVFRDISYLLSKSKTILKNQKSPAPVQFLAEQ